MCVGLAGPCLGLAIFPDWSSHHKFIEDIEIMRFHHTLFRAGIWLSVVSTLSLSACAAPVATPTAVAAKPTVAVTATPAPSPTPTTKSLVVCLGQEPQSLYLYGPASTGMWSILEAIYDGPIDSRDYGLQPVILQKIPSLADKDAVIQPAAVKPGAVIVDADGNLNTLAKGVKVRPSGCTANACSLPYDGASPLQLDQLSVTFKLLPGITWSDGKPLTAADSVYSYQLAADAATPVSKYTTQRTASYTASDAQTVTWTGIPGFIDPDYASEFWVPAPQHLWGQYKAADLLKSADANEKPIGWGPYEIVNWVKGDHIELAKNPNYFRAKEGLPKYDVLEYRFIGENSSASVNALLAGECDVVDPSVGLGDQLPMLEEEQQAKKLTVVTTAGPEWEHLDFGIRSAADDDPTAKTATPHIDLFTDVRTRQAFADCMDRQTIVDQLLNKLSVVPDSFLPPQHPDYDKNVAHYSFDPAAGEKLLDEAGWKDDDNNPDTPRVSVGVAGVPDHTPLVVNYLTTQAVLRGKAAQILQSSLGQCGIQVKIAQKAAGELFAPGPDGPLFGRSFDAAQFSWDIGARSPCFLYTSGHIPTAANHWVGENITGYSNPAFDAACQNALALLPGQAGYQEAQAKVQEVFANDLPVIPLYLDLQVAAVKEGLCGLKMDPTTRSALWNIEAFSEGGACQ
jgi:peptide/nickel transport system substrate-binding protein